MPNETSIASSGVPCAERNVWSCFGTWSRKLARSKVSTVTNPDCKDLLAVFFAHDVRYMVVGGYAVAFHARPRFTKDLDLWIEPSEDNAARAFAALQDFGAPLTEMSSGDLTDPEVVYQIGVPPNRIDMGMSRFS